MTHPQQDHQGCEGCETWQGDGSTAAADDRRPATAVSPPPCAAKTGANRHGFGTRASRTHHSCRLLRVVNIGCLEASRDAETPNSRAQIGHLLGYGQLSGRISSSGSKQLRTPVRKYIRCIKISCERASLAPVHPGTRAAHAPHDRGVRRISPRLAASQPRPTVPFGVSAGSPPGSLGVWPPFSPDDAVLALRQRLDHRPRHVERVGADLRRSVGHPLHG